MESDRADHRAVIDKYRAQAARQLATQSCRVDTPGDDHQIFESHQYVTEAQRNLTKILLDNGQISKEEWIKVEGGDSSASLIRLE